MGPRILDVALTDQGYEELKKKLLETYSVQPTLLNPAEKRLVNWHCLENSCFMKETVFDKREKWMRHHQRFHNRICGSDRGYPKEVEAKQFIQERERREKAARHGIALEGAAAGGSAALMPVPTGTPADPSSRISGALCANPLNSAAPSSSTSGALRGASPNSAAPNPPRSGALRNSAGAPYRPRGPRGPYRPRANKAARPQEQPDQDVAQRNEPESFGTLDDAGREILMRQLSYNLHAVSRINADSVRIMQILAGRKRPRESPKTGAQGYPATAAPTPVPLPTWVDTRALASTSRRPSGPQANGQSKFVNVASHQAPAAAHLNVGPAHVEFEAPVYVFEATPYPSQALAHPPNQALAFSIGGPTANSYEGPGPLSVIERRPAHPFETPALSVDDSAHLTLTYMTPSQPDEKEEEEKYIAASASDSDSDDEFIYQAIDVSEPDDDEGQVEWKDVKVEVHVDGSWP